jgi:hypothetical protein
MSDEQELNILSDTDLIWESPTLRDGTIVTTAAVTAQVYNATDNEEVGGEVTLTYDSTLKEWRGVFEDPAVDDAEADDALVAGGRYYIEYTLAGTEDFDGVDDHRTVWAVAVRRGVGP